jgi:uncharacterized tellurite resistance protein B-like protein
MSDERTRIAAMGIVQAMIFADGEMPESETRWLLGIVADHPLFAGAEEGELTFAMETAFDEAQQGTLARVVEAWAKRIPPQMGESVFELAMRAAYADGKIVRGEEGMSEQLRSLLGVSEAWALELRARLSGG